MSRILLSIKPEHVRNIFNGTKGFEFRKVRCKKPVDSIVIYSTSPVMQVVGEAKVTRVIEGHPEEIWDKTSERAGIDDTYFKDYFGSTLNAYAFELGDVEQYDEPRDISEYGLKVPPQSFIYL